MASSASCGRQPPRRPAAPGGHGARPPRAASARPRCRRAAAARFPRCRRRSARNRLSSRSSSYAARRVLGHRREPVVGGDRVEQGDGGRERRAVGEDLVLVTATGQLDPVQDRLGLRRGDGAPGRGQGQRRPGRDLLERERLEPAVHRPGAPVGHVGRRRPPDQRGRRGRCRRRAARAGSPPRRRRAPRTSGWPAGAARARGPARGGGAPAGAGRRRGGGSGTARRCGRAARRRGSTVPAPRAPPASRPVRAPRRRAGPVSSSSTAVRLRNCTISAGCVVEQLAPEILRDRRGRRRRTRTRPRPGSSWIRERECGEVQARGPALGPFDQRRRGVVVQLETGQLDQRPSLGRRRARGRPGPPRPAPAAPAAGPSPPGSPRASASASWEPGGSCEIEHGQRAAAVGRGEQVGVVDAPARSARSRSKSARPSRGSRTVVPSAPGAVRPASSSGASGSTESRARAR